jgi:hypothetical protein
LRDDVGFVKSIFEDYIIVPFQGESLERIDKLFSKPWLERIDLFYYLRFGCPWGVRRRRSYSVTSGNRLQERDGDRRVLLQEEMGSENGAELETMEATFVVETPSPTGYSTSPLNN